MINNDYKNKLKFCNKIPEKMTSLSSEVKNWIDRREEQLDFILISFDISLVESLVDTILSSENTSRIVLSNKFLDGIRVNKGVGTSKIEQKAPTRIISTIDFGKNPKPCLIFVDFQNGTRFTPLSLDYFENIDRQPRYRKTCRAIVMYRFTGNPPINGYWMLNDSKVDNTSSIIFLELSNWGRICQNAPSPPIFGKEFNPDTILTKPEIDLLWMRSVREYLSYFINAILDTDEYTEEILSDDNIPIWIRSFIHETFNYLKNYESIEFLGDRLCKTNFSIYMIAKYPGLLKNELTEYHNQYMSKDHQWYISDDMNLKELCLCDREVLTFTSKYKTDLMESFVGSLFLTCQNISLDLAFRAVTNYFTLIGESLPFEKKMIYGIDKHRISQVLDSMGFNVNGGDIEIRFQEQNKGSMNARSKFVFIGYARFVGFVEKLQRENNKNISELLNFTYEYDPIKEEKEVAESIFWHSLAAIFDKNGIDIRFAKSLRNSFLYTISFFDPEAFQKVKDTLSRMYPKEDPETLVRRVQFKSNKETDNNYVIMYIHTFETEPDSPLLNSLVAYTDPTQKAGDDFIEEADYLMQTKNLAVVRTPPLGETIGTHTLTSHDLACYNCVKKFIRY